jgi:uncharacterized protein YkwD
MRRGKDSVGLLLALAYLVLHSSCIPPMGVSPCPHNPAQGLLAEINRVRSLAGVPPVRPNEHLARAAQGHATDLAAGRGDGHFGPDGSDPLVRITDAGYMPNAFGENIAWGSSTPERIVQAWMDSPGHRMVLLDPYYDEIGLGGVPEAGPPIWVADFGAQREPATGRCHHWPIE